MVNIQKKRAILLTATVIPNSIHTSYSDSKKRLLEYLDCISFYCKHFANDDVFFLENSNYDLENDPDYIQLKNKVNFTTWRFTPSDKYNEGKGYQEFEMIDKAIDKLQGYNEFIKITGRYKVLNVQTITANYNGNLVIDLNKNYLMAQTYFFICDINFYKTHFKNCYLLVNDSKSKTIESVIYFILKEKNLFSNCKLFSKTPLLMGKTGSYGIDLKRNPVRVFVRNIERKVYPLFSINQFSF